MLPLRALLTAIIAFATLLTSTADAARPLGDILHDLGSATLAQAQSVAASQTTEGGTPKYNSETANETVTFEGTFVPGSSETRLAIFSDDGCDVYVNGQKIHGKFQVGQHLPNLSQSFHVLSFAGQSGQGVRIRVKYSNTIHPGAWDIDGCTLFAFDGGGDSPPDPEIDEILVKREGDDHIYHDGDTIYLPRLANDSTYLQAITGTDDPWPPGTPKWEQNLTPGATVNVSLNEASSSTAGTDYTVRYNGLQTTVHVVIVHIQIFGPSLPTIIQDAAGRSIEIEAQVQPSGFNITWSVPDAPAYIKTTSHPTVSGVSKFEIELDKNVGGWETFEDDKWLWPEASVSIADMSQPLLVRALKFRRGNSVMPGSQTIVVPANHGATPIGFEFDGQPQNLVFPDGRPTVSTSAHAIQFPSTIGATMDVDSASADLAVHYYSSDDCGNAHEYEISVPIEFRGRLEVQGAKWRNGSWFNNAQISLLASVRGLVGGVMATFPEDSLGRAFEGYVGSGVISIMFDESFGGAIEFPIAIIPRERQFKFTLNPTATHEWSVSGSHVSKSQIDKSAMIRVACGTRVEQQSDREFVLISSSGLVAAPPTSIEISFIPTY